MRDISGSLFRIARKKCLRMRKKTWALMLLTLTSTLAFSKHTGWCPGGFPPTCTKAWPSQAVYCTSADGSCSDSVSPKRPTGIQLQCFAPLPSTIKCCDQDVTTWDMVDYDNTCLWAELDIKDKVLELASLPSPPRVFLPTCDGQLVPLSAWRKI